MKMTTITIAVLTLLSLGVHAHEGHNHAPGQVQPIKGGVIMKGGKFYLEVVGTHNEIRFYPLQQESVKSLMLMPIPLNDVKLTATYTLPREKKVQSISLSPKSDYFFGKVNSKNSHRYQVDVAIETLGEKEQLTYQIEPQE